MLLKSLELQGFKTFPDRTKLKFDKGITSVVGPNGSGKSNISDAIRWVLGEQSPKSLRCSKMEDVVFNGTDSRKRQGYAEVTLTFDNVDRKLQFDGDEVAVSRRYYRSGESEYLINKATVRLKDIHELFMDTGLGRDGYSMIGQGKIDSIVASKSEDRREIFEEAAGISRYRYRKLETERKLAQTEENLIRLRDILTELKERVGPLKIQSEKAQAFLEYSKEKRSLEIALWLETLNKSSAVLKQHDDNIDIARSQHAQVEGLLKKIAQDTEDIYTQNGIYSSEIESTREKISQLEGEISSKRSSVSVAENDLEHNNADIERIKNEILSLEGAAVNVISEIKEKEEKISQIETLIKENQKQYEALTAKLNEINLKSSKSNDLLQEYTAKISELNIKYSDAKVIEMTSSSNITELSDRKEALLKSLDDKSNSQKTLDDMVSSYKEECASLENKVTTLENTIKGIELKMSGRVKRRDSLKAQSETLSLDINEALRKIRLLSDLEQNYEGFFHSVKTVMQLHKNGALSGIHGPVSRVISVPSEYNVAIETALGNAMQNIVTGNEDDAKRAINLLKQRDGGRATFLPLTTIKGKQLNEQNLDSCYGFVGIASELCSAKPEYTNILTSLLGRIVIANDLNSAVSIAKKYSYRFKIVTLDGQVVNAGGSLTGGSSNKKSGLLSRASEINKTKKDVEKLKSTYTGVCEELKKAQADFSACEADILGANAELSLAKQDLARKTAEYNAAQNELSGFKRAISDIKAEISALEQRISSSHHSKQEAVKVMEDYAAQISGLQNKASAVSENKENITDTRDKLYSDLQDIRLKIVTGEKDIENLKSEILFARSSTQNQDIRKKELDLQIAEIEKKNELTNERIEKLNSDIETLNRSVENYNKRINDLNSKKDELEKKTVELRRLEREKNSEKENISREFSRLEERKINLQKQYDDIISKLWEEYELTKREAEQQAIKIENVTAARSRLNELKQKIRALGNVNVSAIEEYKDVNSRYEFLSVQVGDVEKSKKDLESLINDLTKQMKEAFILSFNEINRNFTQTFKELFGGGTASLALSDPENILSSGIDIIVHPPGKIVVHLEALSGGEKALVAISLYFAIMKVRPAPFCVMDEIEAALDEVNVDRFAQYLRRLTESTQFILITHRRGTMEEADVLYGVTMQDEGVSKLLELRTSEIAQKFTQGQSVDT